MTQPEAVLVAATVAALVSLAVSLITATANRFLDVARWRREERSRLNAVRREHYSKLLALSLQVQRDKHKTTSLLESMTELEAVAQMLGEDPVAKAVTTLAELHYKAWASQNSQYNDYELFVARNKFIRAARKELGAGEPIEGTASN